MSHVRPPRPFLRKGSGTEKYKINYPVMSRRSAPPAIETPILHGSQRSPFHPQLDDREDNRSRPRSAFLSGSEVDDEVFEVSARHSAEDDARSRHASGTSALSDGALYSSHVTNGRHTAEQILSRPITAGTNDSGRGSGGRTASGGREAAAGGGEGGRRPTSSSSNSAITPLSRVNSAASSRPPTIVHDITPERTTPGNTTASFVRTEDEINERHRLTHAPPKYPDALTAAIMQGYDGREDVGDLTAPSTIHSASPLPPPHEVPIRAEEEPMRQQQPEQQQHEVISHGHLEQRTVLSRAALERREKAEEMRDVVARLESRHTNMSSEASSAGWSPAPSTAGAEVGETRAAKKPAVVMEPTDSRVFRAQTVSVGAEHRGGDKEEERNGWNTADDHATRAFLGVDRQRRLDDAFPAAGTSAVRQRDEQPPRASQKTTTDAPTKRQFPLPASFACDPPSTPQAVPQPSRYAPKVFAAEDGEGYGRPPSLFELAERRAVEQLQFAFAHFDYVEATYKAQLEKLTRALKEKQAEVEEERVEAARERDALQVERKRLRDREKFYAETESEKCKILKEQIADLESKVTEAQRKTAGERAERTKLEEKLKMKETELKKASEENKKLREKLATLESEKAMTRGKQAVHAMRAEVEERAARAPRTPSMTRRRGLLEPRGKENEPPLASSPKPPPPPSQMLPSQPQKTVRWNLPVATSASSSNSLYYYQQPAQPVVIGGMVGELVDDWGTLQELVERNDFAQEGVVELFRSLDGSNEWTKKTTMRECGCVILEYSNADGRWISKQGVELNYFAKVGSLTVDFEGTKIRQFADGQLEIFRRTGEMSLVTAAGLHKEMYLEDGGTFVEIFDERGRRRRDRSMEWDEHRRTRHATNGYVYYDQEKGTIEWCEPDFELFLQRDAKWAKLTIYPMRIQIAMLLPSYDAVTMKHLYKTGPGRDDVAKKPCCEFGRQARERNTSVAPEQHQQR